MRSFKARLKVPAIAAPMFLVSGPDLVAETCKAGICGTFPALNQRTSEGFEEWLNEIEDRLGPDDAPYGVNLIVHQSNPRVMADLELCVKHKVPLIITSLGAVPDLVAAVHSYGGLVFHDVIQRRHAEKAVEAGVDGIIAVAAGAGGHAGTYSPFALVSRNSRVLRWRDHPFGQHEPWRAHSRRRSDGGRFRLFRQPFHRRRRKHGHRMAKRT